MTTHQRLLASAARAGIILCATLAACAEPSAEHGPSLLGEALSTRLVAGDIPDFNQLGDTGAIHVVQSEQVAASGYGMAQSDLRPVAGRPVILLTPDSLAALVRQRTVYYVNVGPLHRDGDTWKAGLGVEFETPEPLLIPALCCCWGTAVFALRDDHLEFTGWESRGCS